MDTNKMPAEMLAQFDAAFRAKFGCGIAEVSAAQDEDSMAMMGAAMWAWQASREAVAVELPMVPRSGRAGERLIAMHAKDEYREAAVNAIEAQGLKVAV